VVANLLDQFEFEFDVVEAGPLAEGKRFQKDTPACCASLESKKLQQARAAADSSTAAL
jgi:hypothetical protein